MLLHNADVSDSQKDTILSAAAASVPSNVDSKSNDDGVGMVSYESLASVICQLGRGTSFTPETRFNQSKRSGNVSTADRA